MNSNLKKLSRWNYENVKVAKCEYFLIVDTNTYKKNLPLGN